MNLPSILVVDDEPRNFDVIEVILSNQNYELQYASSGLEAIESLEIMPIDLILLDVMMPEMDGIEVCAKIKANPQWRPIPIIMVTALTEKEDLAECFKAGADDFLSKPVNFLELRARVNSMLRIKQQYDEIQQFSKLQGDTINILSRNLQELSGNLVSTLPYELNTPLNGIVDALGILVEDHREMDTEEVHEFLELCHESALRLQNSTQKFLTYLKLEIPQKDQGEALIKPVDPDDVPDKNIITYLVQNQAKKANRLNDLVVNLVHAKPAINQQDFEYIVIETMENACKFSQPGNSVTVTSKTHNHRFDFTITNQGKVMSDEEISQVKSSQQIDRKVYEQGVGLGLKIVWKILKMYGGELSIFSTDPEGTTVQIELPLISPNQFPGNGGELSFLSS